MLAKLVSRWGLDGAFMRYYHDRPAGGPLERLTPRELEVLGLMAEGKSNAGIAKTLVLTVGAVVSATVKAMVPLHGPSPAPFDTRIHHTAAPAASWAGVALSMPASGEAPRSVTSASLRPVAITPCT